MSVNEKMTTLANDVRGLSGAVSSLGLDAMHTQLNLSQVEVDTQADIIEQIKVALQGKVAVAPALQEKRVIPSEEQQIVIFDDGFDGLSRVIVEAMENNASSIYTTTATLSSRNQTISFTGLTEEPKMFAIIPTAQVTLSTSYRYVVNVIYDGSATHGIYAYGSSSTYRAYYSNTYFTTTYSDGTLSVKTSSTSNGGYFMNGVAYKLVAITGAVASDDSGDSDNTIGEYPDYTYSNSNITLVTDSTSTDGTKNWRLKCTGTGTLTFNKDPGPIDVFLVGGGGGGEAYSQYSNYYGGGGGGGETTTVSNIPVIVGQGNLITVGAGGSGGTNGGNSEAFDQIAQGGKKGGTNEKGVGGDGGSGGGGSSNSANKFGTGGEDGSDGESGYNRSGGNGQGTTTREFGESNGTLYAGGGGGGIYWDSGDITSIGAAGGAGGGGRGGARMLSSLTNGETNTGGGGGGCGAYNTTERAGGKGGSGIVIIRNHRS